MGLALSELTSEMQEAFKVEWRNAKGSEAPEMGGDERRMMFAAISRGLLKYLNSHQDDFITSITFQEGDEQIDHSVIAAQLDIRTDQ